jgi:hypothetical protein
MSTLKKSLAVVIVGVAGMLPVRADPAVAQPAREYAEMTNRGIAGPAPNQAVASFFDRLYDYTPLSRPTPHPPHDFYYSTTSPYWSVVAIRSPNADYDLQVFGDSAHSVPLGSSLYGGSTVDFVAVDTNRRPMGGYYPRVFAYSGSGQYQIELAQGATILYSGTSTLTIGEQHVVVVRDTYLNAGDPVTISLTPHNGQESELFLLGSIPQDPRTFVRSRANALAASTVPGPGAFQQIAFTSGISGWYGVVVVNRVGSGGYTLTRS